MSATVVGIVGSRGYRRLDLVASIVRDIARFDPDAVVISGGADGVDHAAEEAAKTALLQVVSYRPTRFDSIYDKPLWTIETVTHGERAQALVVSKSRRINPPCFGTFAGAAHARNGWIVDDVDRLRAFWDGLSRGTAGTIELAEQRERPYRVFGPNGERMVSTEHRAA